MNGNFVGEHIITGLLSAIAWFFLFARGVSEQQRRRRSADEIHLSTCLCIVRAPGIIRTGGSVYVYMRVPNLPIYVSEKGVVSAPMEMYGRHGHLIYSAGHCPGAVYIRYKVTHG